MMPLNRLMCVVLWSVVYRHGRSVFGVCRTALAIPLLVRAWSFAILAS